MKLYWVCICMLCMHMATAQKTENIIIITTDGLRWQELFYGLDTMIARNNNYHQNDSAFLFQQFGGSQTESRKKIMPFLWTQLAASGQIYGNRSLGSFVNNTNPYWFSYPGYNELLTGFADSAINTNSYPANPHVTVLEYLQQLPSFKNKVAVFGAWNAFDRIINEERSGIPVVCGFDEAGGKSPTAKEKLLNKMLKDAYRPWGDEECLDVFTHYAAMEYLTTHHPRILYIAYGETDEWAHAGKYKNYVQAAHQVDQWVGEIWRFVQSNSQYKNKTTLLITTDHGRGDKHKNEWTSHGKNIAGSNEMWLAIMGPNIHPLGEVTMGAPIEQRQIAQTIATLLGHHYTGKHTIAPAIATVFK